MTLISKINNMYQNISKKRFFFCIASLPWIIVTVVIAITFLQKGYISYESNDDAFLGMISGGSFGHKYAMNIYNNVVYGWLLTILYTVSSAHNWYTIVQYMLYFIALLVFGVCNIYKNKLIKGYITNFIILAATLNTMICNMNYSKTGAFSIAVGIFLMGKAIDNDEYKSVENRLFKFMGVVFTIVGGLMRKDSLYAIVPFVLVVVVYFAIKYKKASIKRLVPFFIAGGVLAMSWLGNDLAYNLNPEWKHYLEYNKARTAALDYGLADFQENKEAYEAIGISEIEYKMLNEWCYADEDVFSIDMLEKIVEIREQSREKLPLDERINELADDFLHKADTYRAVYILLFLFLAVCINPRKELFWYQLTVMLLGVGEIFGLLIIGRSPERSVYIAAVAGLLLIVFFMSELTNGFTKVVETLVLVFIGVYAYYGIGYAKIEDKFSNIVYDKTYSDAFYAYLNDHPDNLYIYTVFYESYFSYDCSSPLDHIHECKRTNAVISGGWPIPAPIYTSLIEPYGDKYNLFKTLAENDSVYLITIGNYEDLPLTQYLNKHYGVKPVKVDEFADLYEVISFTK